MPSPLPRQVGWILFARLSPSPAAFPVKKSGRLLQLFFWGLLSVHSCYGLHARRVAKRPFPSKAPTASLPRCRFDCYRVERTSSRAGVTPAKVQRLSRRTFSPTVETGPAYNALEESHPMAESSNPETFDEIVDWAYSTLPQKIKDLPDFPGIQVA